MFRIFKKKNVETIIEDFEKKAFCVWKVREVNISTKLRFRAILGFYSALVLSVTIKDSSEVKRLSNKINSELKNTMKSKTLRVSDLFSSSTGKTCINISQSNFMKNANIESANVIMNGLGIFEELQETISDDCVKFFQNSNMAQILVRGMILMKDVTIGDSDAGDFLTETKLVEDFNLFLTEMLKRVS